MSPSRKPAVIAGSPQTPSIRRPLLTPPVTGVGMNSTRRSAAPIHALVGEAARPGPASASASKNPTQTWTALKRIDGPQVVEGDQWKPGYKASKVEEMPAVLYCPAHTPAGGDRPSKVVAEREGFEPSRPLTRPNGFRDRPDRPLWHLSARPRDQKAREGVPPAPVDGRGRSLTYDPCRCNGRARGSARSATGTGIGEPSPGEG